ncbi:hypothetical protein AAG906_025703 [Vitis piasezkii]
MESFNDLCCTSRSPRYAKTPKIPTEIIPPAPTAPSIVPTPEATSSAPPTTPEAPPMVVIRAHQDQLIAMQTQHTAILSQIQQHLGILPPPKHDMPGPSDEATPIEQTMPHEETTTAEVETPIQSTQETTTEPSSPHDPPTTT